MTHFFQRHKDLEPGKWVKVIGWMDAGEAKAEILSGIKRHRGATTKPGF